MNNILYIKASPRTGWSHSVEVADAFIHAYQQLNPKDQIKTIDIFEKHLPDFDLPATTAKYKIMHAQQHSADEQKTWDQIVSVIDEFKAADKYVLAVPMWNFSIPYRLKQYIDIIVQPGYTFAVTEDGNYQGLVNDKPVFIAYARGGNYAPGTDAEPFDLQKKYLELILAFMGLNDLRSVTVEPTLAGGQDAANQSKTKAIEKAKELARRF